MIPALTLPMEGRRITAGVILRYATRASAERQAKVWANRIANDPVMGTDSGLVPMVAPHFDRWTLVWGKS